MPWKFIVVVPLSFLWCSFDSCSVLIWARLASHSSSRGGFSIATENTTGMSIPSYQYTGNSNETTGLQMRQVNVPATSAIRTEA
jgi:hypothetical protein